MCNFFLVLHKKLISCKIKLRGWPDWDAAASSTEIWYRSEIVFLSKTKNGIPSVSKSHTNYSNGELIVQSVRWEVVRSPQDKEIPPVPIKTYQWEDLRRARNAGGYPWTYLLKPPLEGEITAEDVLRESTPRRSMSREISRSRTHSPAGDDQRILNLDSSPGSSRKHGEEGKDEGVHIPNFSKEISLDSEEDAIKQAVDTYKIQSTDQTTSQSTSHLATPVEIPKNVSPKSILKRRSPEQQYIGISETRDKTKCCHPLVNKIKHLADITLHKLERSDHEKSPQTKRKKTEEVQEIRQLKISPGAVRRQKFSAIKLGDSDEMSKTMSIDSTPPPRKKKEHIYEDIEEAKEKSLHFSPEVNERILGKGEDDSNKENDSIIEKKSNTSQDPSLVAEENGNLKPEEHIMEKLHNVDEVKKEAILLDDEADMEEPNVDEIYQNQLEETMPKDSSPNITITEIIDDTEDIEELGQIPQPHIESSPSPQEDYADKHHNVEDVTGDWSKNNSDHEYEIIEKPPTNIIYTSPLINETPTMVKTDDELSSTTSLERKYLQHTSDEDDQLENFHEDKNEGIVSAEMLQKDIEDRYFVNTPSTVSRTECEVSTSQVDSSALENLPLKRSSRSKNGESLDSKIQQRIKEGKGKLKIQADKLKTRLKNIKESMPDKPKIHLPERPKFKMPERPKITLPDRPKFSLPDRRKFSLPDRPKFKKINISEKLSLGDRKKFTMPERPKFNVPDLPKFKFPDRPKINFSSLGRKKEYKVETESPESSTDLRNVAPVKFETKTYPRLFNRKKKAVPLTISSPALEREDTPPPEFTFTRMKKLSIDKGMARPESPEQPREYGIVDDSTAYDAESDENKQYDETYDFDKVDEEYVDDNTQPRNLQDSLQASDTDVSPSKQEYSHVINEIDNDEFFIRPRGISRENIQVREYLSDEIRQAFKIPKNTLALMGSTSRDTEDHMYANDVEADPELLIDENDALRYSNEDLNDRDDGYYTFPPVRPSRAKKKKKELDSVQYIDESVHASMQFSDVDLEPPEDQLEEQPMDDEMLTEYNADDHINQLEQNERQPVLQHEYANDEFLDYPEDIPIKSQTLPMPPKRKKKSNKSDIMHSSYTDICDIQSEAIWKDSGEPREDIIVYRTEHEYVPQTETVTVEQSPLPPKRSRNRSRSSRGTSLCDDDRTSHGAESLTLDTHVPHEEDVSLCTSRQEIRQESPGYATVDKGPYAPSKSMRRSRSKTPPVRRRKSNSSERKYYTVGPTMPIMPDRPPRKKSSTSLVALNKRSISGDVTQYDEIEEPPFEEVHKDLVSGEVISKMKDRPLPPPPRPPRGSRQKKVTKDDADWKISTESQLVSESASQSYDIKPEVVEIEVSTQTDPLPDDVDYELGMDENLDISMSSSLKDIADDDQFKKSMSKLAESPRISRPTSRSEKSFQLSDPKISELSKSTLGRTSPTVILVERRVSSPTRINEREEMLTEASLTVQHIDVDESHIPDVPPLPMPRSGSSTKQTPKEPPPSSDDRALERISETNRDVHLDNLVTQRLQVRDLDVGRLNVSELQASKILVSDIEGMTLQVAELDSKSGHISVSGIEFSQNIIDEIVKKFAELSTPTSTAQLQQPDNDIEHIRPVSREEETQTDREPEQKEVKVSHTEDQAAPSPPPRPMSADEAAVPPQRPPPPDLTPLLYSYLQDLTMPSTSLYHVRPPRERLFTEFHDSQHQSPTPPTRRMKRKPTAPHTESSSEDSRSRPSPRRMPVPVRAHEPTITEAGAQFLRVCHNSISRTMRNIFNSFMSYISGTEDKKDVQMALVIFLVLIAGLIMFGLSDSRTIHHHHWEFFNPPEGKP